MLKVLRHQQLTEYIFKTVPIGMNNVQNFCNFLNLLPPPTSSLPHPLSPLVIPPTALHPSFHPSSIPPFSPPFLHILPLFLYSSILLHLPFPLSLHHSFNHPLHHSLHLSFPPAISSPFPLSLFPSLPHLSVSQCFCLSLHPYLHFSPISPSISPSIFRSPVSPSLPLSFVFPLFPSPTSNIPLT